MAKMLYKTRSNTDPSRKPRVYFTCHPEDFDHYFEKIAGDIFATHDVALYYTQDMTEAFDEAHLETDLGQMNLFVVPVTFRLLSQPNRAMDFDIAYAKQKEIPILPFMMEQGIDKFYSDPEKFGQRQYLNPYSSDVTEIRYADKLKKYLESVLISDEMAQRVRAAFDAYIFLSYRKKDRRYANELMKLIHKNPECRDIAIWYDEFLTPGESFADNIRKALEDSKLFTLLVTPNLLEEPDGKPNFVMAEEYPAAVEAGKEVLPAEMVPTDRAALASKFRGIPDCADPQDEAAFKQRLIQTIQRVAVTSNNNDPEHNFLIGLAYLEGIDVEVDRQRGIELITVAAEAGLPEAMRTLYKRYSDLSATNIDYPQALKWAERYASHCVQICGETGSDTLNAWDDLALLYSTMGRYQEAKVIGERVYCHRCHLQGEAHVEALRTLRNLADAEFSLGEWFKAGNLWIDLYNRQRKILGKRHPDTLATLNKLAVLFKRVDSKDAKERLKRIYQDICEMAKEILRGSDVEELPALDLLAKISANAHEFGTALRWKTEAYTRRQSALGPEHPDTINALAALGDHYFQRALHLTALELFTKVHALRSKVYGPAHPSTLDALPSVVTCCKITGQYQLMLKTAQTEHELRCGSQGPAHPSTLDALRSIAGAYVSMGRYKKALTCYQQVYDYRCGVLGKSHQDTLTVLQDLAYVYEMTDDFETARACLEEVRAQICASRGEKSAEARAVSRELQELQQESQKAPLVRTFERLKERLETAWSIMEMNSRDRKWAKEKGIKHLL